MIGVENKIKNRVERIERERVHKVKSEKEMREA